MSTQTLLRGGGLVTIVAAILLVITRVTSLTERTVVGQWFAIAYFVVLVFAMASVYGAQSARSGILGLVGYVLTVLGATLIPIFQFAVLARVAGVDPDRAIVQFFNSTPLGLIGPFGFGLGLLVFGVATFRAGVLPRWAGVVLGIGSIVSFFGGNSGLLLIIGAVGDVAIAVGFAWMGWVLLSGRGEMAMRASPAM
jgi:hypothetical protein